MKLSADVHVNTIHVTPRVQDSLIAPILEERAQTRWHFHQWERKRVKKKTKETKKLEEISKSALKFSAQMLLKH